MASRRHCDNNAEIIRRMSRNESVSWRVLLSGGRHEIPSPH
jgi:hypothetical protein